MEISQLRSGWCRAQIKSVLTGRRTSSIPFIPGLLNSSFCILPLIAPRHCPTGTSDTSPAFQRRDTVALNQSPTGTAERLPSQTHPAGVSPHWPIDRGWGSGLGAYSREICNRRATKPAAPPRRKTTRYIFQTDS